MNTAEIVCHAVINRNGDVVRVVYFDGKLWAAAADFHTSLGGKYHADYSHYLKVPRDNTARAQFGVRKNQFLLDEEGCRILCGELKGVGLIAVSDALSWLDSGGLSAGYRSADKAKPYCRAMLATLLDHADEGQAAILMLAIEAEMRSLLGSHCDEELGKACHEIYTRYWLQGGEA